MNTRTLKGRGLQRALFAACVVSVSACGGGGGSDTPTVDPTPVPTPAPGVVTVPDTAGATSAGMTTWLLTLTKATAGMFDAMEPADLSAYVAPTDDVGEPDPNV